MGFRVSAASTLSLLPLFFFPLNKAKVIAKHFLPFFTFCNEVYLATTLISLQNADGFNNLLYWYTWLSTIKNCVAATSQLCCCDND